MSKNSKRPTSKNEKKEWPVVVYMWTFGLGLLGYLIIGEGIFVIRPHPIHWFSGLVGGLVGIPLGWLWYRWRGDVI